MEWQSWGRRLVDVLELRLAPVAVTYAEEAPQGAVTDKCRVCRALQEAAQGAVVDMTAGNSACPGGSQYLGLEAQPPERQATVRDFLIHGEKLFSCPAAINRSMALAKVKPPMGLAPHVVFAPLPSAPLAPDVVVFICNAWQGARLINLAYFETGEPMECDPTGSLCRSAITYPLVTNRVNVTFGDVTARRMERYGEDELFVSLPHSAFRSVVSSLDRCSAGTAKVEIPPAMQELMAESGGELPEI
jgi:uncharacterized protein (DUF169 family)